MNQSLFLFIHNFSGRSPILDGIGIFFANYLVYFLVLGFLFLVLVEDGSRRKLYRFAEGALAILLSRGIVTELIRHFYYHPRPFEFYGFVSLVPESGASFPSGHMTFLFALAMAVWYANRKWGIVYFLLSLVVGIARIYAGVHWPLDILGGIVVGIACGMIVHGLLRSSRKALYLKTTETGPR
jgi:undecaprenyl-diphosphatase